MQQSMRVKLFCINIKFHIKLNLKLHFYQIKFLKLKYVYKMYVAICNIYRDSTIFYTKEITTY